MESPNIERIAGRVSGMEIVLSTFMAAFMSDEPNREAMADTLFENCRRLEETLPDEAAADGARDSIAAVEQLTRAVLSRLS